MQNRKLEFKVEPLFKVETQLGLENDENSSFSDEQTPIHTPPNHSPQDYWLVRDRPRKEIRPHQV